MKEIDERSYLEELVERYRSINGTTDEHERDALEDFDEREEEYAEFEEPDDFEDNKTN